MFATKCGERAWDSKTGNKRTEETNYWTYLKIDEKENARMKKSTEETKESENPHSTDFKCDKCNYIASTKKVLKHHLTMKHKPDSDPKPSSKTPTVCVGQLNGCSASTSEYLCPGSAICPACDFKLSEFWIQLHALIASVH